MIHFNHKADLMDEALGLSKDEVMYVRNIVLYETLITYHRTKDLFDSIEDAPHDLRASSAVLERCIKFCKNEQQNVYMLLNFFALHTRAASGAATLEVIEKASKQNDITSKLKVNLLRMKSADFIPLNELVIKSKSLSDFHSRVISIQNGTHSEDCIGDNSIDELLKSALLGKDEEDEHGSDEE